MKMKKKYLELCQEGMKRSKQIDINGGRKGTVRESYIMRFGCYLQEPLHRFMSSEL